MEYFLGDKSITYEVIIIDPTLGFKAFLDIVNHSLSCHSNLVLSPCITLSVITSGEIEGSEICNDSFKDC